MQKKTVVKVTTFAVVLALFVVMLGAYTRLTDAGLGCPDWPGCYGQMVLPSAGKMVHEAQNKYPQIPIESRKAWTEMIHRYAAGTLGLLIFFIGFAVLNQGKQSKELPWKLPLLMMMLVLFQAALGMWTVTLKLLPAVVMTHLLGGMTLFALLVGFRWQISSIKGERLPKIRPWVNLSLVVIVLQIALGGWVSSNYAGIACIGFPRCNGIWFPDMYFAKGFNLFSPVGLNYQGGLLDNCARVSIQFIHRVGAVLTALYVVSLALFTLSKAQETPLKRAAWALIFLVCVQFILGVLNVMYLLPLSVAVMHNGVAALLLAAAVTTLHFTRKDNHAN
jgi:cytochrome c oxidase assembly protein subunit 15